MKKITFNFRNIQTGQLEPLTGYAVNMSGLSFGAYKKYDWTLYELRSGFIFLSAEKHGESLKSCIQRVKERIEKYGINEINKRINAAAAKFAVSGEANKTGD